MRYRTQRLERLSRHLPCLMRQELQLVRRRLATFPEAMQAVMYAAHALRRPVTKLTPQDVEA